MTDQSSQSKELELAEVAQISGEESAPKKSSLLTNPSVWVALISSLFGGTALGTFITGIYTVHLEQKKYEYSLVQKALDTKDTKQAAKALDFLVEVGIIKGLDEKGIKSLIGSPDKLPITKYSLPDYMVYACNDKVRIEDIKDVVNSLAVMPRVGSVKINTLPENNKISLNSPTITIVYDYYENSEIKSITDNLKKIKFKNNNKTVTPTINSLINNQGETKWTLDIIVCPPN